MSGDKSIPPVPIGDEFPEAGKRVRLNIPPPDGRGTRLTTLDDARVDQRLADVVGRVAGLLHAGRDYPLFEERAVECWIREARPGFFKMEETDSLSIFCGAALGTKHVARLFKAIATSWALAQEPPHPSLVTNLIEKVGVFEGVLYYVETPGLPEVIFPDLVLDSIRFYQMLLFSSESPLGMRAPDKYLDGLAAGSDPENLIPLEPLVASLLSATPPDQRSEFISQIGHEIRKMPR